ncbi:hypothetical protein OG510_31430 [Streptomyces sp. NBC_01089]|nr:hypothetical protein OG510_31430 [Streptomyces sp. NBC_01089]
MRPGLLRVLHSLADTMPVTVHDGRLDLLACNAAATELFGPPPEGRPFARNIVHQCFTAPSFSEVLGEQGAAEHARVVTAEFRSALGRYPEDEYLHALFKELTATSAVFGDYWECGEVGAPRSAAERLHHTTRGWLDFDVEVLHDPERDHWIMLYAPAAPGAG